MSRRGRNPEVSHGFGGRLLEVLADQRITQQALAEKLGASASFVSALVRGLKVPGADFIVALHDALGVSLNWLLLGQGTMYGDEVNSDLLQSTVLQVQLVRRATVNKDIEAWVLLRNAFPEFDLPTSRLPPPSEERLHGFLEALMAENQDLPVAISLVNTALAQGSTPERRHQAIGTAIAGLMRAHVAPSILQVLKTNIEVAPAPRPSTSDDNINWHRPSAPDALTATPPDQTAPRKPSAVPPPRRKRGS